MGYAEGGLYYFYYGGEAVGCAGGVGYYFVGGGQEVVVAPEDDVEGGGLFDGSGDHDATDGGGGGEVTGLEDGNFEELSGAVAHDLGRPGDGGGVRVGRERDALAIDADGIRLSFSSDSLGPRSVDRVVLEEVSGRF